MSGSQTTTSDADKLIVSLKESLIMIETRTNYPYESYDEIRREANEALAKIKGFIVNRRV